MDPGLRDFDQSCKKVEERRICSPVHGWSLNCDFQAVSVDSPDFRELGPGNQVKLKNNAGFPFDFMRFSNLDL